MSAARAWAAVRGRYDRIVGARRGRDRLLVAALAALAAADVALVADGFRGGRAANLAYLAAAILPLWWRRRAPLVVLAAVVASALAGRLALYGLEHQPPIEPWLALLVALYALTARTSARTAGIALAVAAAAVLGVDVAATAADAPPGQIWPSWAFYPAAAALGFAAQRRERERDQAARRAAEDERARVARELHDVIAHSVSVMVVQAAAERRTLPAAQASTQDVLAQIEQTGREALVELRRLLGVLRKREEAPDLAPQPGLARLDGLVDRARKAGLSVEVRSEGDPFVLAAGVDLSAYRIIQEALTNTVKHGGARRAEVLLRYARLELEIAVRDDGDGRPRLDGAAGGNGLAGMRERVALYGGQLEAGCRRDGPGFEVCARLPLSGGAG